MHYKTEKHNLEGRLIFQKKLIIKCKAEIIWYCFVLFLFSDFLPFLKSLLCNPIYMLFILISVIQFNAFVNMISFMPKYLEQQYGKSSSDAIFLIGMFVLCQLAAHFFPWNGEQCNDGSRKLLNWNLLEYFCLWFISPFCSPVKSRKGKEGRKPGSPGFLLLFALSLVRT